MTKSVPRPFAESSHSILEFDVFDGIYLQWLSVFDENRGRINTNSIADPFRYMFVAAVCSIKNERLV